MTHDGRGLALSIRYGIIGTGMMGCEHIRNLAAMDDVDIVAVADPNEEPREWAIQSCGDRFSPRVMRITGICSMTIASMP